MASAAAWNAGSRTARRVPASAVRVLAVALIFLTIFGSVADGARVTSIRSHLPCKGQPNGRDVLRCEVEGRKTEVLLDFEINNRRGGGDVLFRHVIDVLPGAGNARQQPNHRLYEDLYGLRFGPDGQPHLAGIQPSICHGPAYCMVPLYPDEGTGRTGVVITGRVDRQRTAWIMKAVNNHVPFVQIQRRLEVYDSLSTPGLNETLGQVNPALFPPLTGNVSDAASFIIDGSHLHSCRGNDARYPFRSPAVVSASAASNTAEIDAALSAAGVSFAMADTDPLLGQLGVTTPVSCGCDAGLCFNPSANVTRGIVEVADFGNQCMAHSIEGHGFPLFVIEVKVENLATGEEATAYTIVKGRGHTARFWQEDQPRGRATIAARAHVAPHKKGSYENAAGPIAPHGAGVMVCGRGHFSTWAPAATRLPSAAQYWGRGLSSTDSENANVTFAVQQALGLSLPVPTALGHPDDPPGPPGHHRAEEPGMPHGSDLAWYWLTAERLEKLGRHCGQVGASRCEIFGRSQAQLDQLCAGTLNCTPPFEDQPIGALADLNIRARHVPTQQFVRNLANAQLTRPQAAALPRSEFLPPPNFYDEAAPSLYLARVHGGGPRASGAQTLPLALVLEEAGAGGAASATEGALRDQRHNVAVAVELDDSWLRSPISEHYAAGANGTIYYQELLLEGSQCYRNEDRSNRGDVRLGAGYVQLTFCPVVDLPVRTVRHGSNEPMTMAYRAEIECDEPVGSFAAVGARLDVHSPTHVTTHFRLAVGGPSDSCTRVANIITLVAAQASASPPDDCPTCTAGGSIGATFTGVCNVTLYSDEPESSHVQVGNATALPCVWHSGDGLPEGFETTYQTDEPPLCGWISTNSRLCPYATARWWILITTVVAAFVALLILVIAVCACIDLCRAKKRSVAGQEHSAGEEAEGEDAFLLSDFTY